MGWIVPWLHPPTVHGVAQSMAVCPLIHGMDRPVPPFPPPGPPVCAWCVAQLCLSPPQMRVEHSYPPPKLGTVLGGSGATTAWVGGC